MRAEVGPVSRKRILVLGAVGFVLVFSWIAKRNEPSARPEAPVQAETSTTENRLPPPAPAGATTGEAPTYTPPEASSLVGIWSVYNGGFVWLWPDGRAEARDGGCRLTSSPRWEWNRQLETLFLTSEESVLELIMRDFPQNLKLGDEVTVIPMSGSVVRTSWRFLSGDPDEECS